MSDQVPCRRVHQRLPKWAAIVIGSGFLVVMSPVVLAWLVVMSIVAIVLHLTAWLRCLWRGPLILVVYSNSPLWLRHIEANWLPRLPPGALILNWSEREHWRRSSFSVLLFRFFGGGKNFNPLAVVIKPFRGADVIRFFKPFRELKGGQPDNLRHAECRLFRALGQREYPPSTLTFGGNA